MITHREFSAWIVSEGKPLPEYLVAVDNGTNKVSCWIPSKSGESFSVHWKDEGTGVQSCAFISLDGFVVPARFLQGGGETSREGVRTGPDTERPFVFAEQGENTMPGTRVNQHAGTITLKIRLVSMDGERPANPLQQLPEPSSSQNASIPFGRERKTFPQYPFTWKVKPYDRSGNRSYVTFVFRHRSREFLLSQGIMPAEDAFQIPRAVRQTCVGKRRVVSAPSRSSASVTASATPSPFSNSEQTAVPIPAASAKIGSVNTTYQATRYPGEGVLDLGSY